MKNIATATFLFAVLSLNSQDIQVKPSLRKSYWASVSEFVFSAADLGLVRIYDSGTPLTTPPEGVLSNPVPRFSAFLHIAQQLHVNINRFSGIYTGWGLRNIGMINNLNDTLRLKQRAYSLSVPFALKLGNMEKRSYLALGAELDYMFHYKQKVFVGDGRGDKDNKKAEWFSNQVNAINPGVFAEFNFGKSGYFRLKYYLNDFLNPSVGQEFRAKGNTFYFTSERSTLFSLTIGKVLVSKRNKSKKTPIKKATA
jgi:hypothetical protein